VYSHNILIVFAFFIISSSTLASNPEIKLADPTRPPNTKSSIIKQRPSPRWILSSTLIANNRRHAVINGRIVRIGQTILQAKIISIQPTSVWFVLRKKRFRIKMLANNIKDFSNLADK